MDTSSWRELDAGWRDRLVWLHDDYYFRRQEALWKANALRTLPVRSRKMSHHLPVLLQIHSRHPTRAIFGSQKASQRRALSELPVTATPHKVGSHGLAGSTDVR